MTGVTRSQTPSAAERALRFAVVYEDPAFELAAFGDVRDGHFVGPTSGGDTLLGLAASGAKVTGCDINRSQNHHVELVHAAITQLTREETLMLLDVTPGALAARQALMARLSLSRDARAWWQQRPRAVSSGVFTSGSTEWGMRVLATAMSRFLAGRGAIAALLAARTSAAQAEIFDSRVATRRWWAGVHLALNRVTCRAMYREFFAHIDAAALSTSIRDGVTAAFRDVPVWENHYLHLLFEGRYRHTCLPDFLKRTPEQWGDVHLVDGDLTSTLIRQPLGSLDGVWLSNVGEWLPSPAFEELLVASARAVRPGGKVIWSNFVPRRDPLPASLVGQLARVGAPDVLDRSLIRYQRIVCVVR